MTAIDPLFSINNQRLASQNERCDAGETSFTVDGEGTIRRCHFVAEPIGSIDDDDWERAFKSRGCPNATCGCYIGYRNLQRLNLEKIYGDNILERIPISPVLKIVTCQESL